jgi:hypothetical protein
MLADEMRSGKCQRTEPRRLYLQVRRVRRLITSLGWEKSVFQDGFMCGGGFETFARSRLSEARQLC